MQQPMAPQPQVIPPSVPQQAPQVQAQGGQNMLGGLNTHTQIAQPAQQQMLQRALQQVGGR
jgi:hypothetical protein